MKKFINNKLKAGDNIVDKILQNSFYIRRLNEMKVLYHIDAESKWHMVLENVKNMIKYGKENNTAFEIEIVANGIAVVGLIQEVAQKSKWYLEMDELYKEQVTFAVCENALKKYNPSHALLCTFATVVPAGVVEIVKKHEEGYAYIKS